MDSFARGVIAKEPSSNNPVIMFADDVQLRTRSRDGLQALLRIVEDDHLSLLEVDTLIIYRLLDCQHNGRTTSACSKFKRPLRSRDDRWIERLP